MAGLSSKSGDNPAGGAPTGQRPESALDFREVVSTLGEGLLIIGRDGRIVEVNRAAEDILGVGREEILGHIPLDSPWRPCDQEGSPLTREGLPSSLAFAAKLPQRNLILRLVNDDGRDKWVKVNATPLFRPGDSQPYAVIDTFTDITEQRRMEQELLASEIRYRHLVEHAPAGIFQMDLATGKVLSTNDVMANYLDLSREETENLKITDILGPEGKKLFLSRSRAFLNGDQPTATAEYRFRDKKGRWHWALINTRVVETRDGKPSLAQCVATDITGRKLTEEALAKSEARLRAIYDNSPVPIALATPEGRWIQANRAFCSLLGYAEEELKGMTVIEITHPADREASRHYISDIGKGIIPFHRQEKRYLDREGRVIWVDLWVTALWEREGAPATFLGISPDVTQRHQAVEALRNSEERLRILFEGAEDSIFIVEIDPQGEPLRFVDANPSTCRALGYSLEELRELEPARLMGQADVRKVRAAMQSILRQGRTSFELTVTTREGRAIPQEIYAHLLVREGRLLVMAVSRDITQRLKAMEEERRRGRLAGKLKTALFSIATHPAVREGDLRGAASMIAREVGRTLEVERVGVWLEEEEGRFHLAGMYHPADGSHLAGEILARTEYPVFFQALAESRVIHTPRAGEDLRTAAFHRDHLAPQGVDSFLSAPIRLAGDMTGFVCLGQAGPSRDWLPEEVSFAGEVADQVAQAIQNRRRHLDEEERKRLEEALRQAHKMEAVGTLAGGIAHDFNNILGGVMGFSELALEKVREGQDNTQELERILEASERARGLIQQILTFSRRMEKRPVPVDLNRVVERAAGLLARTIPRMIRLETALTPGLPALMADPTQLEQVILNLASNAKDAMQDGGVLTIGTGFEPEGEAGEDRVILTVADTGQGMESTLLKNIFDPFFTTKEVGKGTGLGLATVYGVVKDHGGDVAVESSPGGGSVFRISLPTGPEGEIPAQAPAGTQAVDAQGKTILLVDDEETLLDLGSRFLGRQGYQVLTARSGEEALEVLQARPGGVDLVLLDLGMPGMGGQRCLEEIMKRGEGIRVVITSGYGHQAYRRAALEAGAVGYVAKPFRRMEMLEEVAAAFGAPGSRPTGE